MKQLRARETDVCPFAVPPKLPRGSFQWVRPELVAQVAFHEWTDGGGLRAPGLPRPARRQGPAGRRPRDLTPESESGGLAGAPDLLGRLGLVGVGSAAAFLAAVRFLVVCAVLVTDGWRPLASRASLRLASSAAARSMTVPFGSGASSNTSSRPAALSSMIFSTEARYSSVYWAGIEVVAQRVDEALRHLQFLGGHLDAVELLELLERVRAPRARRGTPASTASVATRRSGSPRGTPSGA